MREINVGAKWRDFAIFFIMKGQGQPVVSQFVLHAGPQIPQYLARSRLKDSHRYNYNKSRVALTNSPHEIIINVKPNNLPHNEVNTQGENVRAEVDACLDAIQIAHSQLKNGKLQQNFIEAEDVIHRIDNNIVMDYVSTVYRDYKIRDRFGAFNPVPLKEAAIINVAQQEPRQMQARERASSLNRHLPRHQKQFLNVTQQSRLLKPQTYLSSSKLNKTNIQFTKPDHQRTFSSQSPPNPNPNSIRLHQTATKRSQLYEKIVEDFRFCVNCEKSILSMNVNFHEQYECPDFESLYRLSFKQLSQVVEEKIRRIRGELKEKVRKLKEKNMDGLTKMETIASTMISLIEDYVKEEKSEIMRFKDEVVEEQRRLSFNMFKESQINDYSDAVELTHKLHWLQEISKKLKREEMNNTYESTKRLEQIKPIQILRLATPPNTKTVIIEQSPVAYLHPHLHRFTRQS